MTTADRKLRVLGEDETLPPLREPTKPLPFGDVELVVERRGDDVVIWVVGMPLLTASLDEAAQLADVLRSIVGRP